MRKIATILLALMLVSAAAFASGAGPFYAPGGYYSLGWGFDAGNLLTLSGGVWSGDVTSGMAAGTYEGKVAVEGWGESYPNSNQRVYISGPTDVVHWTFDANAHGDGWLPNMDIAMNDHAIPAGTAFEVIGGAPETGSWGSGVAATLVGDVWSVEITIATAGTYEVKFRNVNPADPWGINVGSDGVGTNSNNANYTTTEANQAVLFQFNQATGRMRVLVGGWPVPTTGSTWGALKALYR